MALSRNKKEKAVENLKQVFESSSSIIVAHYRGLSVTKLEELRKSARENGVGFKVSKNNLAKIAAEGTVFENIAELFSGPTAIAYANDEVAPAKTLANFSKNNDLFEIVGGAVSGNALDANGVKSLASMPSLDESRAKLVGLLQAPASKIASVVQAPGGQLARVFGAYGSSS